MSKIPVYLITGFLGSGKTTLLERAIDYFNGKGKIGIVQNEFAPANIDSKMLKRTINADFYLLEINNGSVFCVCLLSGFITSLKSFAEQHRPDVIFIESSGLSDVISVAEVFDAPDLQKLVFLAGTICIVDAVNFNKTINLMPRVKHQIMLADHLLINKTDLIQDINHIRATTERINPYGKIYATSYCDALPDQLFLPMLKPSWEKLPGLTTLTNSARPDIQSAVFRSVKPLQSTHMDDFIRETASRSYRVKGILWIDNSRCIALQTVFQDIRYSEIDCSERKTELIAVGKDINAGVLKRLYQYYSRL